MEELLELSGMEPCGCLVLGLGSSCVRSCLFVCDCLSLSFPLTWVVWAQSDSLKLQPLSSSCSVIELCCFGNHVLPSRYERAVFLMFPA